MSYPIPPRRELVRFGSAATVAAAALVVIVAIADTPLVAVARLAAAVSLVMISQWLIERRLACRIARMERAEYWRIYADVMKDLGGVNDSPSGEFPGVPRR